MTAFLSILALAVFFDLMLNNGDGIATIISSFRKPDTRIKNEMEVLTERIAELNEELEYLEDELSDAIDDEEENIEKRIREKIRTKKQILNSYLSKLERLNENTK
jgi:DNA repair exonuclease SbcCD ATPase subunit